MEQKLYTMNKLYELWNKKVYSWNKLYEFMEQNKRTY